MGLHSWYVPYSIIFKYPTDDIKGWKVGIVANQFSVINPQEAVKGAQFIRLCNQQ